MHLGRHATLMGHRAGRLEKHQRVIGGGVVHPPGRVIVTEGPHIEQLVVTAQAQLEPGSAILGAMAQSENRDPSETPPSGDLETAALLGKRVARLTLKLKNAPDLD